MDDTVLVIVGEWTSSEDGKWEFRVSSKDLARCISFKEDITYDQLVRQIIEVYGVNEEQMVPTLSFWLGGESNVLTPGHMPPISIRCDISLSTYKRKRKISAGMNMFVTFDQVRAVEDETAEEDNVADTRIVDQASSLDDAVLHAHYDELEELLAKQGKGNVAEMTDVAEIPVNMDEEMVDAIDKCNVVDRKGKGKVIEDGSYDGQDVTMDYDGEYDEDDYNFDEWEDIIEKEYPKEWDPYMEQGETSNRKAAHAIAQNDIDNNGHNLQLSLQPVGFNLGVEEESDGDAASPLGGQLPGPPTEDIEIEDCELLSRDAQPFRDNIRGVRCETANMDLRKAEDTIYVGRVFRNKVELRDALSLYAMKELFHYRMKRSDTTRAVAVCVDPKCKWRVFARNYKDSEILEIRKIEPRHTCDVSYRSRYGKNATARILADLLTGKYTHGKKGPRACELPEMVLSEMNVTISYMKAWNAKELAINRARGSEEGSYRYLTTYLHLLKATNPGTITDIYTTLGKKGETLFKYLFFAFGAAVGGYKFLRKVIVIDGTQMKGRYQGCLVAACGQDGNMQIYPLAFGVVDNENEESWAWFFRKLSEIVPDERDLVFVSDRHAAINSGLKTVYPLAHHGSCAVHLFRNVKARYKCDGLAGMVAHAARSFTIGDFKYWFTEIESQRPACAKYLLDIGLPHWTLSHCPGRRYNIMSSNISESLNAAMVKAVDYPIVAMVEFIRTMLMRWFYLRRKHSEKTKTRCTPEVEKILIDHLAESVDCAVLSASEWVYQVNDGVGCVFEVDLANKTCTCKVFDVLMIPCCHALAAVGVRKVDIYSLVGPCYFVEPWRKKYEKIIRPIAREADENIPPGVKEKDINPPETRRGGGRPRKKRIPSRGEGNGPGYKAKKQHKCSRCSALGHNKATCKNPI